MALKKKQRNVLWYAYVICLVVYYELAMIYVGFTVTGFLIAFGGIALITFGFVVLMRRLSRTPTSPLPLPNGGAGQATMAGEATDQPAQPR